MKKKLLALSVLSLCSSLSQAVVLMVEDFEDAAVNYSTSVAEFSDGTGDFFTRTDGSNIGGFVNYNNVQGESYFAAMDIDGEVASATQTMTFSSINISGYENLSFSGLFAEDDDGSNNDWDAPDFVSVEFQIDGSGYQNLFAIENDGSTFNSAPFVDTDFDGVGDGVEITDTFALFAAAISGTGSVLDLRMTLSLNSGDEDIAFDNIMIEGDLAAVPVPAAAWLFGSALAGLGLMRRNKV